MPACFFFVPGGAIIPAKPVLRAESHPDNDATMHSIPARCRVVGQLHQPHRHCVSVGALQPLEPLKLSTSHGGQGQSATVKRGPGNK